MLNPSLVEWLKILQNLMQKLAIKIYASLKLNCHLFADTRFITDPPVVFNTEPVPMLESTDIACVLESIFNSFTSKIETFSIQGSGWVLDRLLNIQLHVAEYQPLQASTTFELLKEIRDKKAVVNIQNTWDRCFLSCISAALYSSADDVHLERPANKFNLQALSFPMQVKDIIKFEKLNNVSVSVHGWTKKLTKMTVLNIPSRCLKM